MEQNKSSNAVERTNSPYVFERITPGNVVTYYGCARQTIPGSRVGYGIIAVHKTKGQPHQQEFTGERFTKWEDAVARVEELNSALFGKEVVR